MSIQTKIDELKEQLSFFEDEIDKYEFIIELGKTSQSLDEKYKTDDNIIRGCASRVWLVCQNNETNMIFSTDSETVIVRGLAKIVQDIFSNESAKDIQDFDINLLSSLGLTQIITPSRQNGVGNMIKKIKKYAQGSIK